MAARKCSENVEVGWSIVHA